MENAADAFRSALLIGADLPPMSTVEITVETIRAEDAHIS
jgi:hypothetical protein